MPRVKRHYLLLVIITLPIILYHTTQVIFQTNNNNAITAISHTNRNIKSAMFPGNQKGQLNSKSERHTLQTTEKNVRIVSYSDKLKKGSRQGKLNWHQTFSVEKGVKNMTIAGEGILVTRNTAQQIHQLASKEYLNEFRPWAINKQRENLNTELEYFKLVDAEKKLKDLIMEKGGEPIRNIVVTTWRSGSSIIGDILDHQPGTYYHYEPLHYFDIVQVRSEELGGRAIRVIRDLLNCTYNNLAESIEHAKKHPWSYFFNPRLWQYCDQLYEVCWDANFLSNICKLFPFQIMKTVRLRLKFAKSLLDDERLGLRILLLVRDPRGTMQSRNHVNFCTTEDCFNPALLCSDLVEDYEAAKTLYEEYPGRFMVLRYEDFSLNPLSASEKLYKFFRLQYSQEIKNYVYIHTVRDDSQNAYTTYRNSTTAAFHWKTDFVNDFTSVEKIQNVCSNAMKLWGYVPAPDAKSLATLQTLSKPPWEDMNVVNVSHEL